MEAEFVLYGLLYLAILSTILFGVRLK